MSFKDEFLYDFAVHMPRVLVCGNTGIIDNVKKIVLISTEQIVVDSGKRFTAVSGKNLIIKEIADERMMIEGEIREVQFYGTSEEN